MVGESDVRSEIATGSGETMSVGEEQLQEDGLSDISETGWETDLEIEGHLVNAQLTNNNIYMYKCSTNFAAYQINTP